MEKLNCAVCHKLIGYGQGDLNDCQFRCEEHRNFVRKPRVFLRPNSVDAYRIINYYVYQEKK